MTQLVLPDNTVLCNFAAVGRLDLLKTVLRGRGRWTEAVAHEAEGSSRALPELVFLAQEGWLGEPIEVAKDEDVRLVERIRRAVFGGSPDKPLQHLGEAQTCHVIEHWPDFRGAWWVSDDTEALRYARHKGFTTRETIDLVSTAVVDGDLGDRGGYDLLLRMADEGRALRLPGSPTDLRR